MYDYGAHHHVFASLFGAVVVQGVAAAISMRSSARAIEAMSGMNVVLAAVVSYVVRGTFFPRQSIATFLVVVWGVRLSWYLYLRGLDPGVPLKSLFVARVVWATFVSLPVVLLNALQSEPELMDATEVCGIIFATTGIVIESHADKQKLRWFSENPTRPDRIAGQPPVCAAGLWSWSRHPNLFGEVLFHVGIYFIAWRVASPVILAGPIYTIFLVAVVSDGPLQQMERRRMVLFASYPRYIEYITKTSLFVPIPPRFYGKLRLGRANTLLPEGTAAS